MFFVAKAMPISYINSKCHYKETERQQNLFDWLFRLCTIIFYSLGIDTYMRKHTVQTSHNLNACRVLHVKASCFTRDFCSTDTQTHAFTRVDQFDTDNDYSL